MISRLEFIVIYHVTFRLDVLMMSILDEGILTDQQKKHKLEIITILGHFLRQANSEKLCKPIWNREVENGGYSWLGWTVIHGNTDEIVTIIKSRQPYDPLLCT